jgi:hypothetical protein
MAVVVELFTTAMAGAANEVTVKFTEAEGDPTVVSSVVTPLVTFGCVPTTLEVTTIVTVQLPLAGRVIPLKVRAVSPLTKEFDPTPVQVPPAN